VKREFVPGIVTELDIDVYHASAGISKTGLDTINKSPWLYYSRHLNPDRPPAPQKAGQLEGSLAHCAVLEPDQFSLRYSVPPKDAPRRPTEAQWSAKKPSEESIAAMNWWREFNAQNEGKFPISAEQYETAMRQAESVRRLPEVAEALARGRAEVSGFWIDPETGAQCRCRPDWVNDCGDTGDILLDLKTYGDASADEFRKQMVRKSYPKQDAFYTDGYSIASGRPVLAFIFVAVETEWPYAANAVMLDDDSKEFGRRHYRKNLATYAECLRTNTWPGYSNAIEIVRLSDWALNNG
jgi:exodeoxyribonuclease VIII